MKNILQLFMVFSMVVTVSIAVAQDKPKIVFEKVIHDYGTFKETDGLQTTTFKFTNEGTAPLVLNSVRASCGCTTPKWTRQPVPPKGTGEIQVTYNPKNRPGSFNKTVTVSSNAINQSVVLRIKGTVAQREKTLAEKYPRKIGTLRVKTNYLSFAKLKQNEVVTKELELINDTDKPIVVGLRTVPKHLTVKVEPETIPAKGKGKLMVTYDAGAVNAFGFTSHRVFLSLDGSKDYKSSIGVSATIEEDFSNLTPEQLANAPVVSFDKSSCDLGEMTQGDKKDYTFMMTNKGKSDLIIRRVRTSCGCTAVAPSKKTIAPGETVPLKVTFNSRGKHGRQSKSVTVITNDPKTPTTVLRVTSNVIVPAK